MTGTCGRRVERLEREAGAHNPIRIAFHQPGEIVPPGTRLVTFTLDSPGGFKGVERDEPCSGSPDECPGATRTRQRPIRTAP